MHFLLLKSIFHFLYAWQILSACCAFHWNGSIQRVNTTKDMRGVWVFWGKWGAGLRLCNCKMWGVITKRRCAKVPWWWDWLKSGAGLQEEGERSLFTTVEVRMYDGMCQENLQWIGGTFSVPEDRETQSSSSANSSATAPRQSERWIWAQFAPQQRALGEGTIRKCSQLPLLSWQGPVTPLTSEEQRMIRMFCSPEAETVFSPSPHTSHPITEPVAYGCHRFQSDRKWSSWGEGGWKKPTKFIFCLFSMAVLSENSQGHEFWVKVRCMYRGLSCLKCFTVLCIGKGKPVKLQEKSSVKKMVLKTWEMHCGWILRESIIYASFLLGYPWHELLVTVGGKTQSCTDYLFNLYNSFSVLCCVRLCLHGPLGSKWIFDCYSHQQGSHQCLFFFFLFFPSLK